VSQRFGQHFLSSTHILERIAEAACPTPTQVAIEIGPGHGSLTERLLPRVERLIALEIDPYLVAELEEKFRDEPRLQVVQCDAMEYDWSQWCPDVICGNLPYYVATPIVVRAARSGVRTVALIQKEVADRITALPRCRDYGFLTVEIGLYAGARSLFHVKPGSFHPPPKVDSTVIALEPNHLAERLAVTDGKFLAFASACFRHKRKTIRNNVASLYSREVMDANPLVSQLVGQRAEQCSIEQLADLWRGLEAHGKGYPAD
jgi:16S rRNA (adenine1518-N6/adenine1519-N6)-dimethyltransferase